MTATVLQGSIWSCLWRLPRKGTPKPLRWSGYPSGSGKGHLWIWEWFAYPPPTTTAPTLTCPALLPAWGGVTWAEGKLKHKVIVGKTVAGTFSRHPLWWRRGQAVAMELEVARSLPSGRPAQLPGASSDAIWGGGGRSPRHVQPQPEPSIFTIMWGGGQGLPCEGGEFLPAPWGLNVWHLSVCHPKQETASRSLSLAQRPGPASGASMGLALLSWLPGSLTALLGARTESTRKIPFSRASSF